MSIPSQLTTAFTATSPYKFDTFLEDLVGRLESVVANRAGTTRPSDVQTGELWLSTAIDGAWKLYHFDGVQDILVGTVDNNNHTWSSNLDYSSIVSYGGTSSITLEKRFGQRLTVKDFGAKGDGTTDDTDAIQSAIVYAGNNGVDLFLPPGQYIVSDTLSIEKHLSLYGLNPGRTLIKTTSGSRDIINIDNVVASIPGVNICGLAFLSSVTRTGGSYITSDGSYGTRIRNCKFIEPYIGISITGAVAQSIIVDDCQISGILSKGIIIDACTQNTIGNSGIMMSSINKVVCTGLPTANAPVGVEVKVVSDLNINELSTLYTAIGIHVNPSTTGDNPDVVQLLNISRCTLDTGDTCGIKINPTGDGVARRISVDKTWACSFSANGIMFTGDGRTLDTSIVDSMCCNNAQNGLSIYSTEVKNTRVIGGTYAGNNGSGLGFAAGVCDFSIHGANIGQTDAAGYAFGPNGGYGATIEAGSSTNFDISNNNFGANTLGQINDGSTGTSKILWPNIGVDAFPVPISAAPNLAWGVDFATSQNGGSGILLSASGSYEIATGSGMVLLHNNSTGALAVFLAYAGTVKKIDGASTLVAGTPSAGQIGLWYNISSGKYTVTNGYTTSQHTTISTIKTRGAS